VTAVGLRSIPPGDSGIILPVRRDRETRRRFLPTGLLVLLAALLLPAASSASFHLTKIRELAPGTTTGYIELQSYSAGQNFLTGHKVTVYNGAGVLLHTVTLDHDLANGQSQRTALIGGTALANGVTPDYPDDALLMDKNGGAVCFDSIPVDCVSWGNITPTGLMALPGPAGPPVSAETGIPNGNAITRTIAPGCATLLEASDDTDDSSVDFSVTPDKNPRPNSEAPTEKACGGGGGGGGNAPQTNIDKGPKKKTTKATAKFKFSSPDAGATFECSIDGKAFKSCDSPLKLKHVKPGKHVFSVRAVVDDVADKSPATLRWKRVAKKG
jgi:hypothetical protein